MKCAVFGFALVLSLAAAAWPAEQTILARVTVYWPGEGQSRARWNGAPLRNGHCAVDPHKIPYGSKVVVDGEELTAVDTGPAVKSRKAARWEGRTAEQRGAAVVDRYFESKQKALAWARSHPAFMLVRVIPPSSPTQGEQASLTEPETQVRTMPLFDWRWLAATAAVAALALPIARGALRRT